MYVAHAQKTLFERAFEAADLFNGTSLLVQPTIGQSADLWRVNRSYASCALKRQKDRALILSGVAPLVPPAVKALPAPVSPEQKLAEVVSELGITTTLTVLAAIEKTAVAV
jgi:hypothetical protein